MKRIPYGISNFEVLREEEYLYVDKNIIYRVIRYICTLSIFYKAQKIWEKFIYIYAAKLL